MARRGWAGTLDVQAQLMRTNLKYVSEAPAGLTDIELHALTVATDEAPQVAPGLLGWMEGACAW